MFGFTHLRGRLLDAPADDPLRCRSCDGACCRSFPSVALNWEEFRTLQELGAQRLHLPLVGPPLLVIDSGCEFLRSGRCAIYLQRPDICRRFICADP